MSWSREDVKILIEEYQKYPCLYLVKSIEYKNKHARTRALEKIVGKINETKPETTINDIKIKFNSLKTNFMTEYKKYKTSIKSGAGEDEVYNPTLWYFNSLSYILDSNEPRMSIDSFSTFTETEKDSEDLFHNDEDSNIYLDISESSDISVPLSISIPFVSPTEATNEPSTSTTPVSHSRSKKRKTDHDNVIKDASEAMKSINNVLHSMKNPIQEKKSDNEVLANYIVNKLCQITDEDIRLDVEHEIMNILYEGVKKCRKTE